MLASTQQPLDLRAPRLYFKEFIKENLIDDVLPNDQPDPWYASQHIMIQTHQLPRRKASEYHAVTCQLPTASRKSSGSARIKSSKARQQAPKTLNLSELSAKMPSSSNRKRPHSTESIIKWMDERLARQQEKSIRMRSQSSPTTESPKLPSVPATPRAPARPHVQRVVKAEPECALKRAHKILSHIPETCIEITPPNRSARRGSSSSLGHKKPNRLDADEWPHILSQGTDEQDRLVAQHYVLRTAFQGDYCVPLRSALQAGAVVLDIGCGSGTWAMEMATEFAASAFIGIDRNRHYPMDIKPKNCFFRSYDISHLPLPFPDNSVDYIFQRDLNWDMLSQAWDPLMAEYMRILKPGGWIELVEPDMKTQSSHILENAMNDKMISALYARRQDPHIAQRLPSVLAGRGFRRIESHFQSLPLGWVEDNARNDVEANRYALAVSSHYMFTLCSLQRWLSQVMGMSQDKYSNYIASLPAEWKRSKTYINWHRIVAQKPPRTSH